MVVSTMANRTIRRSDCEASAVKFTPRSVSISVGGTSGQSKAKRAGGGNELGGLVDNLVNCREDVVGKLDFSHGSASI